jgi:predicted  nucleic acid-binding Zn-ribbon protein
VVVLSAQKKRILALEEHMHHGKREIASLRREISRVQKSFEERIRTELESASRRANAVEQQLLRFEVKLPILAMH